MPEETPEFTPHDIDPIAAQKAADERYAKEIAYLKKKLNTTEDEIKILFPKEADRRAFISDASRLALEGGECVGEDSSEEKPSSKKTKKKAKIEEPKLSPEELKRVDEIEESKKRRKVSPADSCVCHAP